jgi:uncharacterized protein
MKNVMEIEVKGEIFLLLLQKAVYRPQKNQLIISDLHLGKASHFRKQGIALPPESHLKDIDKLQFLLRNIVPESVLILGDLFHSELNREWLWFKELLNEFKSINFILVQGNHDILEEHNYLMSNLLTADLIEEDNFTFSHEPFISPGKINFCGHIHPGMRITGIARQSITLPCFFHNKDHFILPSFGHLTGMYLLEREENSDYYLITQETIVKL